MQHLKDLKPASVRREEMAVDKKRKDAELKDSIYLQISLWLSEAQQFSPVFVNKHVGERLTEDEILELTRALIEAGYAVLFAKGFFCIEVPIGPTNSRAAGVWMKSDDSLSSLAESFIAAGYVVNELS